MQTRNDGTHVILHTAAPISRRSDRAGLPVMILRQSVGKVRQDGSRAANKQRNYPAADEKPSLSTTTRDFGRDIIPETQRWQNDDVQDQPYRIGYVRAPELAIGHFPVRKFMA